MSDNNGREPSLGGDSNRFKQWCVIELFGHQMIAGLVSDQAIGGDTFIRVDVPAIEGRAEYTKLYGKGAIYAITPCTEETARRAAASLNQPPVSEYHFRQQQVTALPQGTMFDDDDYEDDRPF